MMIRVIPLFLFVPLIYAPAQDNVVFRTGVSLVRVDSQVLDRNNRPITNLKPEDFILREGGQTVPISQFASEDMPLDVLFLVDVSASMDPHVQKIADASDRALNVLCKDDRMAIMVFDRSTRVSLPFSSKTDDVRRAFHALLTDENFKGGTDIVTGLVNAADYIGREGRKDARRAIVILTDDQTELERDDVAVMRALTRDNAVLCALIAPDALHTGEQRVISPDLELPDIFGPMFGKGFRNPFPGSRLPQIVTKPRTSSAGTAEIAQDSGGDSMSVDEASALEQTLARLRQRYALFFNLPDGAQPGQVREIEVELSPAARDRFPGAQVHYRRTYMTPNPA